MNGYSDPLACRWASVIFFKDINATKKNIHNIRKVINDLNIKFVHELERSIRDNHHREIARRSQLGGRLDYLGIWE